MKYFFPVIRVVGTVGLLVLSLRHIDIMRLMDVCIHANAIALAAAVMVLAIANPVLAQRWRTILLAERVVVGYATLVKFVFVGSFFNQILPTGIGGDAVRVWQCSRLGVPMGAAFRGVFIDRFAGYVLIVLLGGWTWAGMPQLGADPLTHALLAVIFIGASAVAAAFSVDLLPQAITTLRIVAPFARLSHQIRKVFSAPRRAAVIIVLSAIGTVLPIVSMQLVGNSVGVELSFSDWLVIVPPVILSQLLPISIAGWGVRETLLVLLLAGFGVPREAALSTSILVGATQIAVGLIGGLIWLADGGGRPGAWTRAAIGEPRASGSGAEI